MQESANLSDGRRADPSRPLGWGARVSVFFLWGGVALGLACSSERPVSVVAQGAPDFSLQRLNESVDPVRLSDLEGKNVVLDFWATWCVPCIDQVPPLNAFHQAHAQDADVAVFGVSTDLGGVESVREWVKEQGVRYPILIGGDELALEMGAPGFPVTYVLDGQGRIQRRHVGVIKADELERDLAELRGDAS